MKEKLPCEVCGKPTASQYKVCQSTPACEAERQRRKSGTTKPDYYPCELCGERTRGKYGVCNRNSKCRSEFQKRTRRENPRDREEEKATMRKWRRANHERGLWNNARQRAIKRGIPFTITVEDIKIPEYCPILGIKLSYGEGRLTKASPSVDQVVPGKGYVPDNIMVVSHLANTMKSNASVEELRAFAVYINTHY